MKIARILNGIVFCLVLLGLTSSVDAGLIIQRNFTGGAAPGNTAGGGSLLDVFDAAADWWELAFPDPNGDGSNFALALNFSWAPLGGGSLGLHNLASQGGVPNRETSGSIRFDNDGTSVWFLDPTPHHNEEYLTFTETFEDLGGGVMNVGRVFTNPLGAAIGRHDLLQVAKHEIGHALGMSAANVSYQTETGLDNDIDILAPLPFSGAAIPTTNPGVNVFNAHINRGSTLMWPTFGTGTRRMQSDADILAMAQLSQFQNPVLDPQHVVPEPNSLTLLGLGSIALVLYRRRRTDQPKKQPHKEGAIRDRV